MSETAATAGRGLPFQLSVGFLSDRGRMRERNEDAFALFVPYGDEARPAAADAFFLVADGMGGHEAGDLASRYAADHLAAALTTPAPSGEAEDDLGDLLERLLGEVNHDLVAFASERGIARGLGTTMTVAALRGSSLHLAHVGDSRCYRLREGQLSQLTEDHSWVAEQKRTGLLTAEDAKSHPRRNLITQCLGFDRALRVSHEVHEVRSGDRYLLCTDGLHGLVSDAALARVLTEEPSPQRAAQRLTDLANEGGGDDNITAVLVDFAAPRIPLVGGAIAPHTRAGADSGVAHPSFPTLEVTLPGGDSIAPGATAPVAPVPDRSPRPSRRLSRRIVVAIGALVLLAALLACAVWFRSGAPASQYSVQP